MTATADSRKARDGLRTLAAGVHQAVALTLRSGLEAAEKSAKTSTKFKDRSGGTRQSIHGRILTGTRGFVEAGGAMRVLENGHRAFVSSGPLMRFVVNGHTIFTHKVKIPAMQGRHVMAEGRHVMAEARHVMAEARHVMAEARQRAETALQYGAEYFLGHAIQHAR